MALINTLSGAWPVSVAVAVEGNVLKTKPINRDRRQPALIDQREGEREEVSVFADSHDPPPPPTKL